MMSASSKRVVRPAPHDGHTPPADRPVASKAWAGEDRRQTSRCRGG